MPNLQRALAFEASPPQQLNIQNTLDKWQAVVDGLYAAYEETEPIRAEVVDEESFSPFSSLLGNASTSNVVFYGGSGTLERSFTDVSITTNFKDKLENVDYKNSIGTYTFDFVLSAVSVCRHCGHWCLKGVCVRVWLVYVIDSFWSTVHWLE